MNNDQFILMILWINAPHLLRVSCVSYNYNLTNVFNPPISMEFDFGRLVLLQAGKIVTD